MKQRIKKKNSEQGVTYVHSWRKKEFEIFHFIRAAVNVLNKNGRINSELYCKVYYWLLKKKMIKIKIYEKCTFFT